ncbi:MAG: sulfite exporter TauE/SafE family protein [Rubellimicrobium sp.]|nr:sulfite exporter TauE/SafE family protein [Rubellimicrobium sp.]
MMPDPATLGLLGLLLAVAGAVTGILAGLFGVGGGAITVPLLYAVFGLLAVPEEVRMPLAVGTSLAIIIPTSLQSARGHYLRGVMDTGVIRIWALPVLAGVLAGAAIARFAPAAVFQAVFVLVAGINAVRLFSGSDRWRLSASLPRDGVLRVYGVVIGLASALMGIGGGAITNLVLMLHGHDIRRSVATSSAVGVLISIPGALGYVWAGWGRAGLPPLSLGFVSALAFAVIVPATVLTTRIGVRLAHALPRRALEIGFACFLTLVATRFAVRLAFGL